MTVAANVVIDERFNGPAGSANGGYACGLVANAIEGPAEVSLRAPPPLGRELSLERDGERVLLMDGEQLVAEGAPVEPDWDVPPPVPPDVARDAVAGSPFLARPRPFVTCFVCGPDRDAGDGLEIYPGPVEGRDDLHAGTWTPARELAGEDGAVRPEIVWASLDCPTSGPVATWHSPGEDLRPIVLARLAVDIRAPVVPEREHVVIAWPNAIDGRKRHSGAALLSGDGELLASARALWIELKPSAG
jgi:hypothetical protein